MTTPEQAIADFWRYFEEHKDEIARLSTADHPDYDALLGRLQRIHEGLFIEFSTGPESCELIVTAEGDVELLGLAEKTVSEAPDVEGWAILALKPKLGFPEFSQWEGRKIAVRELVFEPLSTEAPDDLGLRVFVPELDAKDADKAHAAIVRAIDHGLGERCFAEEVQYLEVCPLPEDDRPDRHIPLVNLEGFIEWRKKRRR